MTPSADIPEEIKKLVFQYVTSNDINSLRTLIQQHNLNVEVSDENGMTPLTHAAYKGHKEICQILLDHGADVNTKKHEHAYTALHFAALSGNSELCQILLDAGAKSHPLNSVGRTPSQMAAFVGNHSCVAVINNYIPRGEVDYYTTCHGLEEEPKLQRLYAPPLHRLIMQVNMHPVRVALNTLPTLVEALAAAKKVLELMSERQMKVRCNEVMSFKLHYLASILGQISNSKSGEKGPEAVEVFVRKVLVPKRGDEFVDLLVRDIVRDFPYRDCTLFRQMVGSLSDGSNLRSGLGVVTAAINGQSVGGREEVRLCGTCQEEGAPKKCSKCRTVSYCNRECQRLHWRFHKKLCSRTTTDDR